MLSYIAQHASIDFIGSLPHHIVNKTSDDKRLLSLNNDACTPLFDYDRSLAERMINDNRFNPETLIEKILLSNEHMYLQAVNIRPHYNIIIKYAVIHNLSDIFATQVIIHGNDAEVDFGDIAKYDRSDMLEFMDRRFILRGWNDTLRYCIKYNSVECAKYVIQHHSDLIKFSDHNQALLHATVVHNRVRIASIIVPYCEVQSSMVDYCIRYGRISMLLILLSRVTSQHMSKVVKEISLQSFVLPYQLRHYIIPTIGLVVGLFMGLMFITIFNIIYSRM